jgi:hypothetical protein
MKREELTHFGSPQIKLQSEKVEYDVDATEGEKTKAINVTGPDGSNVLGSKRLYRKHKGGGSGGPDGEEAPGEPEAHWRDDTAIANIYKKTTRTTTTTTKELRE